MASRGLLQSQFSFTLEREQTEKVLLQLEPMLGETLRGDPEFPPGRRRHRHECTVSLGRVQRH